MMKLIGQWWREHQDETWKCVLIMLGSVVWFIGRELMARQRFPFVSPLAHDVVGKRQEQPLSPTEGM